MPPSLTSVVVAMAFVQASALLARRRQATLLAVLVDRIDDPVDTRVAADGLVLRVDEDDFEVFVRAVLVDPVAVEDTEIGAALANTGFGGRFEGALVLELVDTLIRWLACSTSSVIVHKASKDRNCMHTVCSTLWHRPLPPSSPHTHAVDDIALLGLPSQTLGLVWARRFRSTVDDVQLAELN